MGHQEGGAVQKQQQYERLSLAFSARKQAGRHPYLLPD
jgi:hypothetical protein